MSYPSARLFVQTGLSRCSDFLEQHQIQDHKSGEYSIRRKDSQAVFLEVAEHPFHRYRSEDKGNNDSDDRGDFPEMVDDKRAVFERRIRTRRAERAEPEQKAEFDRCFQAESEQDRSQDRDETTIHARPQSDTLCDPDDDCFARSYRFDGTSAFGCLPVLFVRNMMTSPPASRAVATGVWLRRRLSICLFSATPATAAGTNAQTSAMSSCRPSTFRPTIP